MKSLFSRVFGKFTKKQLVWSLVVIILVLVAVFFFINRNGNDTEDVVVVQRAEFVKEISVSGKVVASEDVDLSFAETGRVASLNVKVGDQVTKGQTLASLSTGTLLSQLAAARANLAQKIAEGRNTQTSLSEVQKEQDTLVASARANLLSNDLVAVPSMDSVTAEPPVITGLYTGNEGTYKIRIRLGEGSSQGDYELLTFEAEKSGPVEILDDEPTALGTKGLFISFPDGASEYNDTIWYIKIPNTKSSTYLSAYNSYQEALRTRDRAIADAGAELAQNGNNLTVSQAEIQSAEAEVARIQSEIAERTIVAPFGGIITAVDAKLGGVASANESAVSIMSADNLQIESYVPEIHVPFISIGNEAVVTLDAYGTDVPFIATIISIDPAETIRDGVSTYRAKLQFQNKDERVKSGMTANVIITSERKPDTIAIPQGAVTSKNGKKFVRVKEGENIIEREVTVNGISSFGEIEILSGLNEGDIVVLSAVE
jgi:HlyD family secretion protein